MFPGARNCSWYSVELGRLGKAIVKGSEITAGP